MSQHAPTPPMGWNSWDCFGTTVTEAEVLANAEFHGRAPAAVRLGHRRRRHRLVRPDRAAHGYNDDAPLALDEYGRLIPDAAGSRQLADGRGFGAARRGGARARAEVRASTRCAASRGGPSSTTCRSRHGGPRATSPTPPRRASGTPTCSAWTTTTPPRRRTTTHLVALFAEWGVDFIKADDMLWPYQERDIEAYAQAIERTGRDIQLSLSPGATCRRTHVGHLREHATMWRICDDLWDRWEDVEANFARFARWAPYAASRRMARRRHAAARPHRHPRRTRRRPRQPAHLDERAR